MNNETIEVVDCNGDGISLPARRILCPRCNGNGKVDNPAFDGGITASEWDEWDDFGREAYLCGRYDVKCPECEGRKWVLEVDESECTPEEVLQYRTYQEELLALRMEREAERRFGC